MGFKQTSSNPCLYVKFDSEGVMFLVAVYVDDIILGGRIAAKLNAVKKELNHTFKMKDLGLLHHFLGVKIIQDPDTRTIWMGQPTYTEKILLRYGMHNSKPVSTPVNTDVKLVARRDK